MKQQTQVNLLGTKIEVSSYHKLSENYKKILEIFVNNPDAKLNQDALSKYFVRNKIMSRVTILRFLKDAAEFGYIKEMKTTKIVVTKQGYRSIKKILFDDGLETPDMDKRKKYYQVTNKGIGIFEKQ